MVTRFCQATLKNEQNGNATELSFPRPRCSGQSDTQPGPFSLVLGLMRTALLWSMQQISPSAREGTASQDFQYVLTKDTGTEHHASRRARILSDPRQEPPPGASAKQSKRY